MKVESPIDQLQKRFFRGNKDKTSGSDLVIFAQKWMKMGAQNIVCMDLQRNLHGSTTELSWTHDGISMDS